MLRKLKLIMAALLLVGVAKAQNRDDASYLTPSGIWDRPDKDKIWISQDLTVTLTGDVTINDQIIINDNVTLTIQLPQDNSAQSVTIKRGTTRTCLFHIGNKNNGQAGTAGHLVIKGYKPNDGDARYITLDGGAEWRDYNPEVDDPNDSIRQYIQKCFDAGNDNNVRGAVLANDVKSDRALIFSWRSRLTLEYVIVQNNYVDWQGQSGVYQRGGAICCYGLKAEEGGEPEISFKNTILRNCQNIKGGGGGVFFIGDEFYTPFDEHCKVTFSDCEIYGCADYLISHVPEEVTEYCGGGAIRTNGFTYVDMEMTNCNIHHCYSSEKGGGIIWNVKDRPGDDTHQAEEYALTMTNCQFRYNVSRKSGGGVSNEGKMSLSHCTFEYNKALGNEPNEGYGGGLYSTTYIWANSDYTSDLELDGSTTFNGNVAKYGGGIGYNLVEVLYVGPEMTYNMNLTVNGGTIHDNHASIDGGGVYIAKKTDDPRYVGTFTLKTGYLFNNSADRNGGAVYTEGGVPVTIEGGCIGRNSSTGNNAAPNTAVNGGGFYCKNGNVTMTGGEIINNTCTGDGGGFYVNDGNVNVSSGTIKNNNALQGHGGGFYVNGGDVSLAVSGSDNISISGNKAIDGGGFYANGGNVTLKDANIASNVATGNGGGVYSNGGKFTISNTSGFTGGILSDTAVNGGGGFVNGGTLEITSGNIDDNEASADGGGFYVNGGTLNLYGGIIGQTEGNRAKGNGGGFYLKGGVANIKTDPNNPTSSASAKVQYNNAVNGGGLYLEGTGAADDDNAIAYFENGLIQYNSADEAGGGIYIANYAKLDMSGTSKIIYNHVPAGKKGGGVFKSGQETSEIKVGGLSLELLNNYAGNTYSDDVRNNLFLDGVMDYLTIKPDSQLANGVKVGISIGSYIPTRVIKCTSFDVLNNIYVEMKAAYDNPETATTRVFDDAAKYEPLFAGEPSPFTWDYIFFIQTWDAVFEKVHEDFKPDEGISDATGLTYFMMIQNGIRCDEWMARHPDLDISDIKKMEVELTGDIDLIGLEGTGDTLYWRPVSGDNASDPYQGKFDGKGHTITGMQTIDYMNCSYYGMFGKTKDAEISNLFVQNCRTTSGGAKAAGMLIGQMNGGSVTNVVVSGIVDGSGSGESTTAAALGNCNIGGLVGETEGGARITNCCASAHINAGFKKREGLSDKYFRDNRTAGGLVGLTSSETVIENGFVNLSMIHGSWKPKPVGGLVGYNFGTISNCYVRWDKNEKDKDMIWLNQSPNSDAPFYHAEYESNPFPRSLFGLIVGEDNKGKISYCYMPDGRMINGSRYDYCCLDHGGSVFDSLGDYKPVERPYTYTSYLKDNQAKYSGEYGTGIETTLLSKLNSWVDDANNANRAGKEYSHWMRTKGSDVNGDYPILKYDNKDSYYPSVAGYHCYNDSVYLLEYNKDINEVLKRSNYFGKGCLFVYGQLEDSIKVNNGEGVKTFIDDDVPVLQVADSTLTNVYTCQTIKGSDRKWHLISSSLADSPTGFKYGKTTEVTWNEQPNPCDVNILTNSVDDYKTFFPSGTMVDNIDLYNFYEPEYHWLNLKRNRLSHWHMDYHDWNIGYPEGYDCNDNLDEGSHLVPGRGYLAAIGLIPAKDTEAPEEFLLQAGGTLNNGDVMIAVTNLSNGYYGSELKGYNLLGNPYQSYLSFYKFTQDENNQKLWKQDEAPFYMVFDSENNTYKPGSIVVPSKGSEAASGEINMHQGFFIVKTGTATEAHFTNAMRSDKPEDGTHFRGEAPAYPLVNLMVTDATGSGDVAVVEFDRPEYQSAAKMKHIGADGKIYFHYADDDHALLFLNEDIDQLPVRFDAIEDGTYTMTWSTANATFSYLHLIDNMTGIDVDMLSSDAYTFTASSSDYKSRFKLMFAYTGVEENEAASTSSASFAFMHDGALTVNGEGMLEVIDMSGRTIVSSRLTDAQNTVSLPQAAQGVYVLRLTNDNQSKVQKIVIE